MQEDRDSQVVAMTDIKELCSFMEAVLNGTSPDVVAITRPSFTMDGKPVSFKVRSPALPYTDDTTMESPSLGSFLPVMIEETGGGQYEAFPDAGMYSVSDSVTFLFPVSLYSDVLAFFDYMAKALVGKVLGVGPVSGSVCFNIGQPTFAQMAYLEADQLEQITAATSMIFGHRSSVSRQWASLTFPLYMSGAEGMNEANGIIYGNQGKYTLNIDFGGTVGDLSETLLIVQPSDAMMANTAEEQAIDERIQKGVVTNSAVGTTLTCFVRANPFWLNLIKAKRDGTLPGLNASLSFVVYVAGAVWSDPTGDPMLSCIVKDASLAPEMGKPLCCTLSMNPRAAIEDI